MTKRVMTSNLISGTTQHYAYNNQGWLTQATASGTEAFTYDATGNRTHRTWTLDLLFVNSFTSVTKEILERYAAQGVIKIDKIE